MPPNRDHGCHLVYPYLAQHFVNGLAVAAQALDLSDGHSPIPVEITKQLGLYRSALALTHRPKNLAGLAQQLSAIAQDYLTHHLGQRCLLVAHDSGWIDLQVPIETQLVCLAPLVDEAYLLDTPFQFPAGADIPGELIFELQYAHARCCSVLRIAQQKFPLAPHPPALWLEAYFNAHAYSIEQNLWRELLNFPHHLQAQSQVIPTSQTQATNPPLVTVVIPLTLSENRLQDLGRCSVRLFQKFYSSSQICHLTLPDSRDLLALRLTLFQALRNLLALILTQIYHRSAPQIL